MLTVETKNDRLAFGEHFGLRFHRTLRIPDDGKTYPLPPSLGAFPVLKVADYADHVPTEWREHGGVFIPMYQREALWISFEGQYWKPNAVKIAIGKINAVSGKSWEQRLLAREKDYLVCPPQPWLDGINAGKGFIRQFVAMPLGMGYTVEAQITGEETFGGIQIIVYEPKAGRFPDEPPRDERVRGISMPFAAPMAAAPARMRSGGGEMGLAAGGKMKQQIYPDPHGIETWDQHNYGRVYVHIVNSMMFREITGKEPPATPVTAKQYTQAGLPWFDLYDEYLGDIAAPDALQQIKSTAEMDQIKGFAPQQDDSPIDVSADQITKYTIDNPNEVKDGRW